MRDTDNNPLGPPDVPPNTPGTLVIISGPSGVGKTTITRAVRDCLANTMFSVSATTRAQTAADKDGVDYHFLTNEQFAQKASESAFLEHAEYAGKQYGTLRAPVEEALAKGRTVLLEIDVHGAEQVKREMPEAFAFFILPPSEEDLLTRLRNRKREDEDAIQRRFKIAKEEITRAKESGAYDLFVVNDDLDRAIEEAIAAIRERAPGHAANNS